MTAVFTGVVGAWRIDVTPTDAYAYKRNRDGEWMFHARTSVHRFPVGYRVAAWMRTDMPASAFAMGNKLAKQMTREVTR